MKDDNKKYLMEKCGHQWKDLSELTSDRERWQAYVVGIKQPRTLQDSYEKQAYIVLA